MYNIQTKPHHEKISSRNIANRTALFLLMGVFALLAACSNQTAIPETEATPVMVKASNGAATLTELDGSTVSGDIWVVVESHPRITEVAFYIDDAERTGQPLATLQSAPFEIQIDTTTLENGTHTVTAVVQSNRGKNDSETVENARIMVGNQVAESNGSTRTAAALAMRGDPTFDETQLSGDARMWYMRFLAALEHPEQYQPSTSLAMSGDLYNYARPLNEYLTTVMTVFRVTGDLRLLDEVDRVAQLMRAELQDAWHGTQDGMDGTSDGYLNWTYRHVSGGSTYIGKDIHIMDEMMTHALVAAFAWAFENNRDLTSPAGVAYGERADFWYDYLKNHFEAKWRSGAPYKSVPWSDGQFISQKNHAHPYIQATRIYHYLDALMERRGEPNHEGGMYDGRYADALEAHTDTAMDAPRVDGSVAGGLYGHGPIETPMGKALIIPFGLPYGSSTVALQALNTTYVRYVHGAARDLYFEGAYRWSETGESGTMARLTVNLAYFIMDTDPIAEVAEPFAQDSVGGLTGWPIPHDEIGFRSRMDADQYAIGQMPVSLAFSPNQAVHDRIESINLQVYEQLEWDLENPKRIFIPAGMFLDQVLQLS